MFEDPGDAIVVQARVYRTQVVTFEVFVTLIYFFIIEKSQNTAKPMLAIRRAIWEIFSANSGMFKFNFLDPGPSKYEQHPN